MRAQDGTSEPQRSDSKAMSLAGGVDARRRDWFTQLFYVHDVESCISLIIEINIR